MTDLEISEQHGELIGKLREMCGLSSDKEVVENALLLLGYAASEVAQGRSFGAIDLALNTYKVLETPALAGARRPEVVPGSPKP